MKKLINSYIIYRLTILLLRLLLTLGTIYYITNYIYI